MTHGKWPRAGWMRVALLLLWVFVSAMQGDAAFGRDGDMGFLKVDTHTPSHVLPMGVMADAENKRSEDGRAWPRYGVDGGPWGILPGGATVPAVWPNAPGTGRSQATVTGLVVGQTYRYMQGNSVLLSEGSAVVNLNAVATGKQYAASAVFVATQTSYVLWANHSTQGSRITARIDRVRKPLGFGRFDDPNGRDNLILVVEDWRDGDGEDGGRGRAYRIVAGVGPVEIPLNGHDAWSTCRVVQCNGGCVLLRQGNERHYVPASAFNTSTNQIQLNCAPAWAEGDKVLFVAEEASVVSGTKPPTTQAQYWVKVISGNLAELYSDPDLAAGHQLDFGGGAVGSFYLERQADAPGFYGNGAPPLILQPDPAVGTAFQAGFVEAPPYVSVTAVADTVVKAPNHRLIPGDQIKFYHAGAATTYYANPQSEDVLTVHTTVDDALAGQNAQSPAFTAGDYLVKGGASGQPMPPAREGTWTKNNRLVLVNGKNQLAISDALDPLHFTPYAATLTIDGDSDPVQAVVELGADALLLGKANRLQILDNFSGGPASWVRRQVTGEYGIYAPLSAIAVGKDVWGLSRKGVVSIAQTELGVLQGVALPKSQAMQKYIDQIDWRYAQGAAAALWNNRYFLAVPLKGQTSQTGLTNQTGNNALLVYNLLNDGWEGIWTGAALNVVSWAKHTIAGEERLCFVNYYGQVCWLGEGWTDLGTAIADRLVTRTYCAGNQEPKIWLRGRVILDQNNASVTVSAQAPGWNESQVVLEKAYDPTKYLYYGQADYDPTTGDFDAPGREDYSVSAGELLSGALDVHQNVSERVRMRVNDWGVQLVIESSRGSCRVAGTEVEFVAGRGMASRES